MSIDITGLSAKELYELARQKEQEEQRQTELKAHLDKFNIQRSELQSQFQRNLAKLDNDIRQLQQQRERMVDDHELDLARLDKEIADIKSKIKAREAQKAQQPVPKITPAKPANHARVDLAPPSRPPIPDKAAGMTSIASYMEEAALPEKVFALLSSRQYISETLLKEKLKAMGYSSQSITKVIEQMTRDKQLIRKDGSYMKGKK